MPPIFIGDGYWFLIRGSLAKNAHIAGHRLLVLASRVGRGARILVPVETKEPTGIISRRDAVAGGRKAGSLRRTSRSSASPPLSRRHATRMSGNAFFRSRLFRRSFG